MTPAAATTNSTANGLNQISVHDGVILSHDPNGNLSSDGTSSYVYRSDNQLLQANGNWLNRDPLERFAQSWSNNDGFDYDGHDLITHRSGSTGPVYERYVHGPGADEPLQAIAASLHLIGDPGRGVVWRQAYETNATWLPMTLGYGTNWNSALGSMNTLFAPATWRAQDASIRRQLEGGRRSSAS